ncbi:MAG TPA: hypothetical protein VE662_01515 [Solirubrobacterales bacterium]|jgi:hypothetical protein|nr:hypothetical protein [Solirubrobacterales bacterium]HYY73472.1 hypothetical protein [Solirubrobacterales bacterium]
MAWVTLEKGEHVTRVTSRWICASTNARSHGPDASTAAESSSVRGAFVTGMP